jgi:hypothetical protein
VTNPDDRFEHPNLGVQEIMYSGGGVEALFFIVIVLIILSR